MLDRLSDEQLPPCVSERVTFMLDREFSILRRHPYAVWSRAHEHLKPVRVRLPAFGAACVPFRWMLSKNAPEIAQQRGINFSGISDLRAPYEIARRRPGFHLVILTLGGEARFRLASMEGVLRPGDLWVVPAGQPQHYYTETEWRIIFFHIGASMPGGTNPLAITAAFRRPR